MLFEGCQGKKGPQIQEMICPNCGETVEMMSNEPVAECEACGSLVFSEQMDCAFRCPQVKECIGPAQYAKMLAAKSQWLAHLEQSNDEDQW